jgi:two-component system nitrogen regulation response regulator GlnG
VGEGKGDAVITDVMMPDGNGLEMLPKIAADRPGLPVIVISAQNTIMTAIQAEEADAFDYLPKPFDLPDLMKRTSRALDAGARQPAPAPEEDRPEELPLIGRTPLPGGGAVDEHRFAGADHRGIGDGQEPDCPCDP